MKKCASVILLVAYVVPYAFLSLYGDAVWDTLLLTGAMIAAFALLCFCALKIGNPVIVFAGNALSSLMSLAAVRFSDLETMNWYFKPFTAASLALTISVIALAVQSVIAIIYIKKHK